MRKWRYITAAVTAVFAFGALWLFAMQYVSLVFDNVTTQQLEAKLLQRVAWNDIYLIAGGHVLDLDLPDKPAVSARIRGDLGKPLMLVDNGEHVVLGQRTSAVINNAETIKPA